MRTTRRRLLGASATMFIAGSQARRALGQTAGQPAPIRIGGLYSVSGAQTVTGNAYLAGALIAAAQINRQGGIAGRQVEIVVRDDKANPNEALAGYLELYDQGVRLFIGSIFPAETAAIMPRMSAGGAILISNASATLDFTHEKFDRHFFRMFHNFYATARAQAVVMAQRYPQVLDWTGICPDVEYGHFLWRCFASGLTEFYPKYAGKPVNLIEPLYMPFVATDFRNQIGQLMQSRAEGLANFLAGASEFTYFTQGKALGLERKIKVFQDSGKDLALGQAMGHNIPHDAWSPTFWYFGDNTSNKLSQALYDDYVARTGDKLPPGLVGSGFAAVRAYAAALATGAVDADAVITALERVSFETASGTMRFRPEDHQVLGDIGLIEMGPTDGEPGWGVIATAKVSGADVVEPATPGREFRF